MKRFLVLILSLIFVTSCSLESDTNQSDNQEIILYTWHLIKTEGGLSGVDDTFSLNTVVWSFDEATGSLAVNNNNEDDSKIDLLDSGIYNFSIETINVKNYISINGTEYGEIIIDTDSFTIDENNKTSGQITDGFIYTFQRVAETQ
jgi:hypothetical protein